MNQTNKSHEDFKTRWPNYIVVVFVLTSVGIAALFGWQSYQLDQQKEQLLSAIETQKQNLITLREQEKIGEKMRAAEILNKAKRYRKNWSQILKDLNETFTDRGVITFNSVTVDSDNTVSVQAKAKDILTAASFLVLVKRSDKFENGFISTISPSSSGVSDSIEYQFNATFDYLPTQTATQRKSVNLSDPS